MSASVELQPKRSNRALVGILSLTAGVLVFSAQDIIVKAINGGYAVGEILFVRSLVSLPILLAVIAAREGFGALRASQLRLNILRGSILFIAYTTYYIALAALSLADTVALGMSSPLFITALSAPILGEVVGIRRAIAVVVGFAGVLLMTRPGTGGFEPAALLALTCALAYGLAQLMARRLGQRDSATVMTFYAALFNVAAAGLCGVLLGDGHLAGTGYKSLDFLLRAWAWPTPLDMGLMIATGVVATIGSALLTEAYRVAEPSVVAPFEFTGVIWAILWGILFFAEVPDRLSIAGILLIVGSGLYILYRESVRRRTISRADVPAG